MISEVKPKNFKRTLTPIEYKIEGYEMVHKKLRKIEEEVCARM